MKSGSLMRSGKTVPSKAQSMRHPAHRTQKPRVQKRENFPKWRQTQNAQSKRRTEAIAPPQVIQTRDIRLLDAGEERRLFPDLLRRQHDLLHVFPAAARGSCGAFGLRLRVLRISRLRRGVFLRSQRSVRRLVLREVVTAHLCAVFFGMGAAPMRALAAAWAPLACLALRLSGRSVGPSNWRFKSKQPNGNRLWAGSCGPCANYGSPEQLRKERSVGDWADLSAAVTGLGPLLGCDTALPATFASVKMREIGNDIKSMLRHQSAGHDWSTRFQGEGFDACMRNPTPQIATIGPSSQSLQ
eukprot:scaffold754_cov248-Pinguiococcus_pyrenoidosus.AAC.49